MKYGFPMGRIRLGSFIEGLAFALNYYHVASNICFNWKSALAARDSICRVEQVTKGAQLLPNAP